MQHAQNEQITSTSIQGHSDPELTRHIAQLTALCVQAASGEPVSPKKSGAPSQLRDLDEKLREFVKSTNARLAAANKQNVENEVILKSLGEGLYVVNLENEIVLMNPHAREKLGLEGMNIISRSLFELFRIEHEDGVEVLPEERPLMQALAQRELQLCSSGRKFLYFVNRKTGKRFPASVTAAPIITKGELIGGVAVFRDSTEEVEVRRAKDEFISLASHQLRTPLSIISLNLEILDRYYKDEYGSDDVRDHIKEITQASERMQALVNAILNVSRIEMGSVDIALEPVDIAAVVKEKLDECAPLFESKHLTVTCEFETPHTEVLADPQLLRIVIDNICSNAVKYSYAKRLIHVRLEELKTCLVLAVTNTGHGIPAHQQSYVYSKLFRAENAQQAAEDGTGLGLYITKSLIEKMEGSTWFESTQDKETTFYVRLPKA